MKHDRSFIVLAALLLAFGPACTPSSTTSITGTGGSSGTGGSNPTGGNSATGGNNATGGSNASGGRGGSGGSTSTGGVLGSGGAAGRGGSGGTAGSNTGGVTGTGGATNTGGAAGHGNGGAGGATGGAGTSGSGGSSGPSSCTDGMQNGSETGVDCGGSCPACPNYKINPPNLKNNATSACQNSGNGFMCVRSMVYSPEFKQAEADDFGSPTNPAFVYGVVGHDADTGGLDSSSNTCCQCYQLVFTTPRDPVSGVPAPKPMIVQAFNTGVGNSKDFDVYMAMGGYGANSNGCPGMYSNIPTIGEPGQGGIRVENLNQCSSNNAFTLASVSTSSCQSAVASTCNMLTSSSATNQSTSQTSCVEANQPQNLYHMNWNVMAKRVECPTNLTRVTGCKLNSQGLPQPDPTAVDSASASGKGFSSGYTTTTMQDCCRPTCAYNANVTRNGVSADSQYGAFYTCDASGNPS